MTDATKVYNYLYSCVNSQSCFVLCRMLKSIYQGGSIMLLAILLFESSFQNIVAITFTALVLCELLNVAFEVNHWHPYMVIAEIITVALYGHSISNWLYSFKCVAGTLAPFSYSERTLTP